MFPSHDQGVGIKEVTSREGSRIEGLLSIHLKIQILNAFEELYFDLVEEDPFHAEDVIEHLSIEMMKHLDDIQAQGEKLAGVGNPSVEFTPGERIGEEDTVEEAAKDIIGVAKSVLRDMPHLDIYIDSLRNDIRLNGEESYYGFSAEDFEEDYDNYIADKALQEHFKRFK